MRIQISRATSRVPKLTTFMLICSPLAFRIANQRHAPDAQGDLDEEQHHEDVQGVAEALQLLDVRRAAASGRRRPDWNGGGSARSRSSPPPPAPRRPAPGATPNCCRRRKRKVANRGNPPTSTSTGTNHSRADQLHQVVQATALEAALQRLVADQVGDRPAETHHEQGSEQRGAGVGQGYSGRSRYARRAGDQPRIVGDLAQRGEAADQPQRAERLAAQDAMQGALAVRAAEQREGKSRTAENSVPQTSP